MSQAKMSLSVLGGVALSAGPVSLKIRSRKAQALLAYMALSERCWVSRDHLAGLLWSEVPTERARASLRQTLFELRAALSEAESMLLIERTEVKLDAAGLESDVFEMLERLRRGDTPDARLFRPDVLDSVLQGFDDISEGFRGWLQGYRAQLGQCFAEALQAGYENDLTSYGVRKRMAEAAIALDPLDEHAYRALMMLSAQEGDLGAALAAYEKLYGVMDAEMGMEPSARTQELIVQIKTGAIGSSAPPDRRPAAASAPPGRWSAPVVAVLPFHLHGPNSVADQLPGVLLDDIVCKLATLREPVVISSNSTRMFASATASLEEVRARLGADYALCGSIGRSGKTYRFSAQLVDTRSSAVVWAESFLLAESELFSTQSFVVEAVAHRLVPSLQASELRLARSNRSSDLTAYQLILRAREQVFDLRKQAHQDAGELLKLAMQKDPGSPLAHTAHANWLSLKIGQGWSEDLGGDLKRLEESARTAVRLSGMSGRALAMLGHTEAIYGRNYEEAFALFARAADASPNDAETVMWSVPSLAWTGQHDRAVELAHRAMALSPEDPFLFRFEHFASIAHFTAGNYETAADLGLRSMARNPHYTSNLRVTAAALVSIREIGRAREIVDTMMKIEPGFSMHEYVQRQGFRDPRRRCDLAEKLIVAGLPSGGWRRSPADSQITTS